MILRDVKHKTIRKMTGLGGVYPNYEDCQLDRKDIAENFSSTFREEIYPINYTSDHGPWAYDIKADPKNFIDLTSLTWNGFVKVREKSNHAAGILTKSSGAVSQIDCSVVNNFIHSCLSVVKCQVNDYQFGEAQSKTYTYKAYLENLLSYSKAAKIQSLKYHGFYPDTAERFDDNDKTVSSNKNDGFKKRAEMFCGSHYFHFSIKLRTDLANVDQYLQPGVSLKFELERNTDTFALMSDCGSDTKFEFHIKDTSIELDKLIPTESYFKHFMREISRENLYYPYDKNTIQTYNFSKDANDLSVFNLFHSDKLPSFLVFGMVEDEAYNGILTKNPFNFKNFDLGEFHLSVNGMMIPSKPIKLDITNGDYHKVFCNDFLDRLKLKETNNSIGITSDEWLNGNFLWMVDLNVDKCANYHEHQPQQGTIHLKMHVKTGLPENARLIVYSSTRERFFIKSQTKEVKSSASM